MDIQNNRIVKTNIVKEHLHWLVDNDDELPEMRFVVRLDALKGDL